MPTKVDNCFLFSIILVIFFYNCEIMLHVIEFIVGECLTACLVYV